MRAAAVGEVARLDPRAGPKASRADAIGRARRVGRRRWSRVLEPASPLASVDELAVRRLRARPCGAQARLARRRRRYATRGIRAQATSRRPGEPRTPLYDATRAATRRPSLGCPSTERIVFAERYCTRSRSGTVDRVCMGTPSAIAGWRPLGRRAAGAARAAGRSERGHRGARRGAQRQRRREQPRARAGRSRRRPSELTPGSDRRRRLASPRDRRGPRELPRRPERRPARGRSRDRGAAARRRRSRLGKDPRPHLSGRAPHPRVRREAERDPRDHVHEQGRGGDARATRADARSDRALDLDPHLPRRLRPHAAARGRAPRLPLDVHDLRQPGSGAARQGVSRGAREGSEALLAARHPRADLAREERARLAGGVRVARRVVLGPDGRRDVRALPAPPARLERRRLRRHPDAHGAGLRALPGGARALAEGVPLRPRRRVPGHEPRAVPAAAAPRRRARERVRSRRSGSVDLQLP